MRRLGLSLAALALGAVLFAPAAGSQAQAPFRSSVSPLGAAFRAQMTSWHKGCPVQPSELRLVRVSFWGFDGRAHSGRLIVQRSYVRPVIKALRTLYYKRFPIRRMRPVEAYGSSDDRSMAADNTSAFNCRGVAGSSAWSEHAYGRAIDINPLENPEVRRGAVSPPGGRAYTDRSKWKKGMIHSGDRAVRAFEAVGWKWGGYWHSLQDYQHFSWNGQ
ncbi:MAG: M15 family metallopeptidase [Gaiellaceae bacterium]